MSRRALFGLVGVAVAVVLVFFAARGLRKKTPDPIVPGPETTVLTGPFDSAGLIDYETALNERLKGKSTPDTNAVVLLVKCIGPKPEGHPLHPDFYKWLGVAPPPDEGEYLGRSWDSFQADRTAENREQFDERERDRLNRPWTEAGDPKFYAVVKANETPLAIAAEASRRPDYFHPMIARRADGTRDNLIGALLPMVQRCREVAYFLRLRAMLRCGEQKYDEAWADVMTIHRLGRLMGHGGTLIERLVGIALDAIANGAALAVLEAARPTAVKALIWRDQLAALPPVLPLADSVELSERYMFLDGMQFIHRDPEQFKQHVSLRAFKEAPEAIPRALIRMDWNRSLKLGNRWYDRACDALRRPTRSERLSALAAVEKYTPDTIRFDVMAGDSLDQILDGTTGDPFADRLVSLFLPLVTKYSEYDCRIEVHFQTEMLAFALAAYLADHGNYPAKLADLVPKYVKAIPNDPYSEKEFIYKPTAKGYELYSVGPNGVDDGGQSLNDDPRGDDYGVRMPNVKRAPAPVPVPPGDGR